ncbi:MAG: hypothetical protein GX235_11330 [Clostridiales bacterium]|nr:hypothetical protein [Clostridiales bacterium]
MYGIFMESVVIFKNYAGNRLVIALFLLSLIFLLFKEKDKRRRAIFVYTPLTLLFLFFFPIFRKIFVRLMSGEGDTYYRVLWLIPMGVIIAYAGVRLAGMVYAKKGKWMKWAVLTALSIAIVFSGKYVYASQYMSKAENLYHLPQTVIDICDLIAPEDGEERIWSVFPTDLVYFVRQYDTDIQMLYGREMVEPKWQYAEPVHSIMNHPTTIDIEELLKLTRERYCTYIVLPSNKDVTEDPENFGLKLLDTVDGYPVYYDPIAADAVLQMQN